MSANVDFIEQEGAGAGFVSKDEKQAFVFDGTSFVAITSPNYPTKTVRGIVYLNGTYYVMTPDARIYGSELNDPTGWSALNVIQALSEPDAGVCLARQINLVVAFGNYSTEFFYNAGNPTGSPLLPYTNSFIQIGCASAGSVVNVDNTIVFMANTKQRGRTFMRLNGTNPESISTPHIDRILDNDLLYGVKAYFIRLNGHMFYMCVLPSSQITLVFDITSNMWSIWTRLEEMASRSVTSYTWDSATGNGTFILPVPHGLEDGRIIRIGDGKYPISIVDEYTFTVYSLESLGTITSYIPYEEDIFDLSGYVKNGNADLILDSTTGTIYALSSGEYLDNDEPIKFQVRTPLFDGNTDNQKFYNRVDLIGDKVAGNAYVAYTNDDYNTWSKYRPVNLNNSRSQLYRLGRGRRRAFDILNVENIPIRLKHIELNVQEGN